MWSERGKTVREAMMRCPALWRFVVVVAVLPAAAVVLSWPGRRGRARSSAVRTGLDPPDRRGD
ncbi:MAG: hypothetical protein JWN03_5705 [Nocardia sp.]|nr:hypothetical protein [Nocardia sp.]